MPPGDSVPAAELHPGVLPTLHPRGESHKLRAGSAWADGRARGARGHPHKASLESSFPAPACGWEQLGGTDPAPEEPRCSASFSFSIVTQEPFTLADESELPPLLSYTYPSGFRQQKRPDVINNPQLLSRQTEVGLPQPPPRLHPGGGCISHHPQLGFFVVTLQ